MNETEASIVLNMLPHVGPMRFQKLHRHFGSAVTILKATGDQLRQIPGIGEEVSSSIRNWEKEVDLAAELKLVSEAGARVVVAADSEYPSLLREIADPPIVLYVLGNLIEQDQRQGIGVVGSRMASHYALEAAKKLSYQLAYAGLTIYSGLARGIDTAAHQAALAAKGRTVAVLGSGLGKLYPRENELLAEKIAQSGAVISEFSMNTPPSKQSFPKRNRIISGCSFGVLVVEAGAHSGALISANQALEQGRSLYAIPGRIDQATAIGSNRLIQQGAKLVIEATDILNDLPLLFSEVPTLAPSQPKNLLVAEDLAIYHAIDNDPTPIDQIIKKSGLPAASVSSRLLALELAGHVRALPGQCYVKLI
ncbi:MAG: DNA-protecting protein DprA [Verrucomicrobia bacterium]|nr:DNA-protecting protein DprA [Verrucomicrobiota bacterium]